MNKLDLRPWQQNFVLLQDDGVTVPITIAGLGDDITGWTFTINIANRVGEEDTNVSSTDCPVTDGPSRIFEIPFGTATSDLAPGIYYYNIDGTFGATSRKAMYGYIQLDAEAPE